MAKLSARFSRKAWCNQRTNFTERWVVLRTVNNNADTSRSATRATFFNSRTLETSQQSVSKWRRRFIQQGMAGLNDAARSGRPVRLSPDKLNTVLTQATQPPKTRTRWSVRSMARHAGVSKTRVQQLWSQNDLKPHLSRTFKFSNDPQFEPKFWDIIGLYLNPPERALVLCCDEKSQCQALERTQPGLPLGVGHIRTRTHDYTRHGTVTLFAALSYLDGKILSQTAARHTHKEWLSFLKHLNDETPAELQLHLIIDNYATHKHPKVKTWLKKHPRFHLHFTPTGSSWMNMVERFFRDLSEDVVREGSFTSTAQLTGAIANYLAERNLNPTRYLWKAKGADILAKIHRARQKQPEI
ncbi:MAG: IS630 family transposase [Verrucomicrobia bacterium]|nr:IS630 family transposase [Verrucomicrobiota bacterium]